MNSAEYVKSLWLVAREYAGFAEAGGVKNVVKALAEYAAQDGFAVTVFLPRYGNNTERLDTCTGAADIRVADTLHPVRYFELSRGGIRFVFVDSPLFTEKKDVYTYCTEELEYFRKKLQRPDLKKGEGYVDSDQMNMLFQKAVYCYGLQQRTAPDVLHCHDAHTALPPAFIFSRLTGRNLFAHTRALITIHNAGDGYRQSLYSLDHALSITGLPHSVLEYGLSGGMVEPFLAGAPYAELTTVSPWYADQLTHPEQSPYSHGFSQILAEKKLLITGITNGIDFTAYDPRNTAVSGLPFAFDIQKEDFDGKYACRSFLLEHLRSIYPPFRLYKEVQWLGTLSPHESGKEVYAVYHGRFVHQKGVEVLLKTIPLMLQSCPQIRFILMGQGNPALETEAITLTEVFSGQVVYCKGYNRQAARLVTAAADFIILPSLFEPCGLEDLIAQIYGTLPIANAQGGLKKIIHGKTGFLYDGSPDGKGVDTGVHAQALMEAVLCQTEYFLRSGCTRLLDIPFFKQMILYAYQALLTEFSWKEVFHNRYRPLYCSTQQAPSGFRAGRA